MADELRAGEVIADRYELRAPLGRGGSSTTWRALDRSTQQEVALKRLDVARAADWKYVELFEREGKLLAQIQHPAIPRYLGAFTVEGPNGTSFFLAQSLIEGVSLSEHVAQRGSFLEGEVKDVARQVLRVLVDLHGMTPPVLHRDLKPGNILFDAQKKVHLVDFGAARQRGDDTGSTVVGTYGYMAPEQLRGSATAASDLYGLGATLVFLLYRVTPAELPQTRLRVTLPKKPFISSELAAFIRRLLEPAPEDRFLSAREALAALDNPSPPVARFVILSAVFIVVASGAGYIMWHKEKRPPLAVNGAKPPLADLPIRLELYRYPELRSLRRVPAHTSAVFDVALSSDGKYVASASFDRTAKVWTSDDFKAVASVGHDGPVGGVRFANATTLVTGGDHTLRTWDLPSGKPKLKVDVGALQISGIDVRGDSAAVASFDGHARIVSLADGSIVRTLAHSPKGGRVLHVSYSPDGNTIATGGEDRVVRLWSAADGTPGRALAGHGAAISHVAFSPDGTLIATTGDDKLVRVFNVASGAILATLREATNHTWGVAWSPSGDHLFFGEKGARLFAYRAPTFELRDQVDDEAGGTLAIASLSDGRFVTGNGDGTIHLRALGAGKPHAVPVAKPPVPRVMPDGPKELVLAREAETLVDHWDGHRAKLDGAEKLAQEALTLHPEFAPALAQLARIEMRRGYRKARDYDPARLASARKLAERAIAGDAKCFEAREIFAWTVIRQKDYEAGRKAIADAEKVAPTNPAAGLLRAEIALREKAWDEAERVLRGILEGGFADEKTLASAEESLLETYTELGDLDAVDELHRRNVARNPKSAWIHGNYAGFLLQRGNYGRAIELANQAIALSDYGLVHVTLAAAHVGAATEALWGRRDRDGATSHLAVALKQNPNSADAHYAMAAVHRMRAVQGRDRNALAESKKELLIALKLDPEHGFAKHAMQEHGDLERNL